MALILIAGVPGTSKTTIGDHLRDAHGYRHFDVEADVLPDPALNARWFGSPSSFLADRALQSGRALPADRDQHFVDAADPAAAFRDKETIAQEILRLVEGS